MTKARDLNNPLVYHLFGTFKDPASLVLTEDDYYDYLVNTAQPAGLIPDEVTQAQMNSLLLILGFEMDDWNFRVLLRSITSRTGTRRKYPHVAVQMNPEEGRMRDLDRARTYLEKYFSEKDKINLYWGGVEDFMQALHDNWIAEPRFAKDYPL